MMWQHCGRYDDHDEHNFSAYQRIAVQTCTCSNNPCTCPEDSLRVGGRIRGPRQKFRCPGKQVRSTEIPVKTEVSV